MKAELIRDNVHGELFVFASPTTRYEACYANVLTRINTREPTLGPVSVDRVVPKGLQVQMD